MINPAPVVRKSRFTKLRKSDPLLSHVPAAAVHIASGTLLAGNAVMPD
jgi:hypothetical protein